MEKERKIRDDKKRAVAPYVSKDIYEILCQIGYICDLPLKTVGEKLFLEGVKSQVVILSIQGMFRRDFLKNENHLFMGNLSRDPYKEKFEGEKRRLNMRFRPYEHGRLAELAFALDCSLQAAAGLIIKISVTRKDILYPMLGQIIIQDLDPQRKNQLKSIACFLDARSPEAHITSPMIMSHIISECLSDQQKILKSMDQLLG